jgi:phospholipid/cholesterol/gamma-HCH transport system substrate-binding protein
MMEVRARYVLIGFFALAVIGSVFAFVYWLDAAGGLGQRLTYRIRFNGPVAGLLKGSPVLFNGVRVGEVASLQLDEQQPSSVLVAIAIDRQTPVRRDTKIDIDFQGLAGAPVVSLVAGSANLPLLSKIQGEKPMLLAKKNAGQGMTQMVRKVLARIEEVLADNADPLKSSIASINTFTTALARNSQKVDGIFAGLERLTGGGSKKATHVYDLTPAKVFPGLKKIPLGEIYMPEPTALATLDAERVVVKGISAAKLGLQDFRWPDILSKVLQVRILQSFENAKFTGVIGRYLEGAKIANQLLIDVREFSISTEPSSTAVVELSARLVTQDGRIVASRVFRASSPVEVPNADAALKALDGSSQKVLSDLVIWVGETLQR